MESRKDQTSVQSMLLRFGAERDMQSIRSLARMRI